MLRRRHLQLTTWLSRYLVNKIGENIRFGVAVDLESLFTFHRTTSNWMKEFSGVNWVPLCDKMGLI